MPREPPLSRAFVSLSLLGVVVPDPGVPGRRERGWGSLAPIPREGPRDLTLLLAGAARLTPRDAVPGARAAAVPSRLCSAGEGHGTDSGAGECGRGLAGSAGPRGRPGSGAFPPPRPPRGRLCVLFPLVPGAVTPISVRGDLREPGGEGRERLCGEPRGGARGAAWPGPRCGTRRSRPAGRGPGSARWPYAESGRSQVSPEDARPVCHQTQPSPHSKSSCPSGTVLESHRCSHSDV